ncbi:hypothetical protein A4A49_52948 [Nicotiana attenuata]|uniref:Uncharacterized protein n=1 Tax=Nicotiana attenuata TaxID=49451 RepID=A0A314KGJ9_NICAT|nr:hypothetical protein A4A49_52948 [Nicotiana attenuata]
MKTQTNKFSAPVRMIIILVLVFFTICSQTSEVAGRVIRYDEHLLLSSLQKRPPVRPPRSNPGTGARTTSTDITSQITERNFAGRKEVTHPPPTSNDEYSQLQLANK